MVTESFVCGASAAGTLRPLLLTHRRCGCVRRVDQQTQRGTDRESVLAQASGFMRIRWLGDASGDTRRVFGSFRAAGCKAGDWNSNHRGARRPVRNRSSGAVNQGDLNLPETSGLSRRIGNEQVVESGAAGLGTGGFARWPERDGLSGRSVGTVSADTIGFGTGRLAPGRRPRRRRRVRTSSLIGLGFEFEGVSIGVVDGQWRCPDGG